METIIITGSGGLIGQEASKFFLSKGFRVIGIDNNMREYFFGKNGSTESVVKSIESDFENYKHYSCDIRNYGELEKIFKKYNSSISLIIHTAAQPSHDWAAKEPLTDFGVNAVGTVNLLELYRLNCPKASFIFTSTNKVYGDAPNRLELVEKEKRFEIRSGHEYEIGIPENMSIDNCLHSVFGASKVSADIMVQEYGKYFNLNTVCFRGGCLTGPIHQGVELHGFLSYIVKCALNDTDYTIFGYNGKQVRDNIHSADLVSAFYSFYKNPRQGEVYNIGGSRFSNCSVIEAIDIIKEVSGKQLKYKISDSNRVGDHKWWISDISKFRTHYPDWDLKYNVKDIIAQIFEQELINNSHIL